MCKTARLEYVYLGLEKLPLLGGLSVKSNSTQAIAMKIPPETSAQAIKLKGSSDKTKFSLAFRNPNVKVPRANDNGR